MPDVTLKNVPGMKSAAAVPVVRVEELNESDFLERFVNRNNPCVIKGAVRHWPAMKNWRDKQHLQGRSGHHRVYFNPYEYHISPEKMASGRQEVSFAEAIERLHAAETDVAIVNTAAPLELLGDLGRLSFLSRAAPAFSYPAARYFFYRNAGTTWHYHPFDETLMCQIVGSKRIGLIATGNPEADAVREIFLKEDYYHDAGAFERLSGAVLPFLTATLEEGDSLYIPPLWWHGVIPLHEGFGATTAVTFRSPLHIEAGIIRKMAAGDPHIVGWAEPSYLPFLQETAKKAGVEKLLEQGWARQFPGSPGAG